MVADPLAGAAAAGEQLPRAGAEVGAGEDRVEHEADQRERERYVVEVHQKPPLLACSGTRASRRRIQATDTPTPR